MMSVTSSESTVVIPEKNNNPILVLSHEEAALRSEISRLL